MQKFPFQKKLQTMVHFLLTKTFILILKESLFGYNTRKKNFFQKAKKWKLYSILHLFSYSFFNSFNFLFIFLCLYPFYNPIDIWAVLMNLM